MQFVVKHDPKMFFQFTSLQSEKGQQLLREYQIPSTVESVVLIEGSKYYTESTAALKIAKKLNNLYPLLFGLIIIPRPVRNKIYRYIARNRYRWFGKRTSCMLPGTEDRNRFLQ